MNDTTARLAALLGEHFDPTTCVREHGMPADEPMFEAHNAHVAAALVEAGVGFTADMWDAHKRAKSLTSEIARSEAHLRVALGYTDDQPDAGLESMAVQAKQRALEVEG